MARFPLYIDMKDRKAVIVGGGKVALRKARILTGFDVDITVVSPDICDELKMMEREGQLCCEQKCLVSGELDILNQAFMVICATGDRQLNHEIACFCRERQIWVDCADSEEDSSFIFPSVVRRNEIVIGISSSGGVPALTRHLRQKIEQTVPEWYGLLEQELRDQRVMFKRNGLSHEEKRAGLRQMIEEAERRWTE